MLRSALHDPRSRSREAFDVDRWRVDLRILDLEAELARTRNELDVLRDTTAQMLTAILTKMQTPTGSAPEIRQLADLDETAGDLDRDPITAEIEKMVFDHETSLACLDRRFRWFRSRRK